MADINQNININLNDDEAKKSISKLKEELNQIIEDAKINIDIDISNADSKIIELRSQLDNIVKDEVIQLSIEADRSKVAELINDIKSIETEVDIIENKQIIVDVVVNDDSIKDLKIPTIDPIEVDIKTNTEDITSKINDVKSSIETISNESVNIDTTNVETKIVDVKSNLQDFKDEVESLNLIPVDLNIDVSKIDESIEGLNSKIGGSLEPVKLDVDAYEAGIKIDSIQEELSNLESTPINLDVNTIKLDVNADKAKILDLFNNIGNVQKQVDILNKKKVDVDVTTNAKDVVKDITKISTEVEGIQSLDTRLDILIDSTESINSVKGITKAIKDLEGIAIESGDVNSEAFKKATMAAGQLQDRINDVKDSTKTFTAGDPTEALSKGLGTLKDRLLDLDFGGFTDEAARLGQVAGGISFDSLTTSLKGVTKGFANLAKTLLANPIFLLGAAIAAIIVYWDDLMSLIDGVSSAQTDNLNIAKEAVSVEQEKYDAISLQENSLKLAGKSEKEILEIKLAQTEQVILASQIALEQQKNLVKSQIEASERNKEILKGVLDFVAYPINLILETIDQVGKALGKDFGLREKFKESVATLIFDPKKVAEEGDKAIAEQQKALDKLVSQRDGFKLQIQGINKAGSEAAIANAQEEADAILEIEKFLADKRLNEREQELASLDEFYADKLNKLNEAFVGQERDSKDYQDAIVKLDEQHNADRVSILDSYVQTAKEKQEELNDFLLNNRPLTQEESRDKEVKVLEDKYNAEKKLAEDNVKTQIEILESFQKEKIRLETEGGSDEEVKINEERISKQIISVETSNRTLELLEEQKLNSIRSKREDFRKEDIRLELENNVLKIQNEAKSIQDSTITFDIRKELVEQQYTAEKILRDEALRQELDDVTKSELEKEAIREKYRGLEIDAEKSKVKEITDINKAQGEALMAQLSVIQNQMAASGNTIGGLGGAIFEAFSNLPLDQIAQSIKVIGDETASASEKAQAALSLASEAVNAIGSVLADISAKKIEQNQVETDSAIQASNTQYEAQRADIEKNITDETKKKQAISQLDAGLSATQDNIRKQSFKKDLELRKKAFKQQKAIQITNAVIQTAQAVISAFSSGAAIPIGGIAAGPIFAAVAGVLGAAQIAAIAAQKFPEGDSAPSAPSTPSISTPSISSFGPDSGGGGFNAPTFFGIGQTPQTPTSTTQPIVIQNNIVETDITSTQRDVNQIETRAQIV